MHLIEVRINRYKNSIAERKLGHNKKCFLINAIFSWLLSMYSNKIWFNAEFKKIPGKSTLCFSGNEDLVYKIIQNNVHILITDEILDILLRMLEFKLFY